MKRRTVWVPQWKNSATGAVTLVEARVMGCDDGRHHRLAFRGKDGKWREKQGWVYVDVYASQAHYNACREARDQSNVVFGLEQKVVDAALDWMRLDGGTNQLRTLQRATVAVARARVKLARLRGKAAELALYEEKSA